MSDNWFKTALLMAAIVALFGVVGGMLGGRTGMLLALLFGSAMNVWAGGFRQAVLKNVQCPRSMPQRPELHQMVAGAGA